MYKDTHCFVCWFTASTGPLIRVLRMFGARKVASALVAFAYKYFILRYLYNINCQKKSRLGRPTVFALILTVFPKAYE